MKAQKEIKSVRSRIFNTAKNKLLILFKIRNMEKFIKKSYSWISLKFIF